MLRVLVVLRVLVLLRVLVVSGRFESIRRIGLSDSYPRSAMVMHKVCSHVAQVLVLEQTHVAEHLAVATLIAS